MSRENTYVEYWEKQGQEPKEPWGFMHLERIF